MRDLWDAAYVELQILAILCAALVTAGLLTRPIRQHSDTQDSAAMTATQVVEMSHSGDLVHFR